MKTELREDVSGHSSVSDMESDSDSPTEVNEMNIPDHAGGSQSAVLARGRML